VVAGGEGEKKKRLLGKKRKGGGKGMGRVSPGPLPSSEDLRTRRIEKEERTKKET